MNEDDVIDNANSLELNGPADRDSDQQVITPREPAEQEPQQREERDEPSFGPYDDKRRELIEAARAKREQDEVELGFRVMPEEIERSRVGHGVETLADREARRNGEDQQQAEAPPTEQVETRRKVKVNGQEKELTEEELVAAAQKGLASEDVLNDAKRLRAQVAEELERVRAMQADHSLIAPSVADAKNAPSPEDTKPGGLDAELVALADTLQLGGSEEAAAALVKIEERILKRLGNVPEIVSATIREQSLDQAVTARASDAAASFFKENSEFEKSQVLQQTLISQTQARMEQALVDGGMDRRIIDGVMRQEGLSRGDAVAFAYRKATALGVPIPDYKTLLDSAAEFIRTDLNLPRRAAQQAPAQQQQQQVPSPSVLASRQERRQAIAPQPKRANATPGAEAQEMSENDRRLRAIQERRMYLRGRP
jgi:hypothetical protein